MFQSTSKCSVLSSFICAQDNFSQLIAELSDTVASCLLDLTDPDVDQDGAIPPSNDVIFSQQIALEGTVNHRRAFNDFEVNLSTAIDANDLNAVNDLLGLAQSMLQQDYGRTHVMRILWTAAIQAEVYIADAIIASEPFDLGFVDDINGRTCLHEAAIAGALRLVNLCLEGGVQVNRVDVYGRTALHYASMKGHPEICRKLLSWNADAHALDMDSYSSLIYAVVNGKLQCVRTLIIDGRVGVEPTESNSDLIPLSLASQYGHVDVVLLLLQHGARRLPNTNGEYPIHLAAREGHVELCRILVAQPDSQKDTPDKYNEWTPLVHAARHGHDACVQVLLEAGCNPHALDEVGKTPALYAAWYGHIGCANRLLKSMEASSPSRIPQGNTSGAHRRGGIFSTSSRSPTSDLDVSPFAAEDDMDTDQDADMIPSLLLPPPIMPFRIYGHNYLDKTYLIQVALGHPFAASGQNTPPIQLLPSIFGQTGYTYSHSGPSIKLVMTSKTNNEAGAIANSHSIVLPLADERETFTFQLKNLDDLTLEFSLYPTFGSKTIGRAVASPSDLKDLRNRNARTIPVLDHRLHVIGQVSAL